MFNYMKADLHRIFTRIPRWISLFIQCLILAGICYITKLVDWSNENFVAAMNMYFTYAAPLFIGLFDLGVIYSDDFKAKTLQVAIGSGISRIQVIIVKFMELAIIALFDLIVQVIVSFLMAGILNAGLTAVQYGDFAVLIFIAWLTALCCTAAAAILMFRNQNGEIGKLIYIAIWLPVPSLLRYLLEIGPWAQLQLSKYLYSEQLSLLSSYLMLRKMNFGCLISIVIFIAVCFVITVLLNRHKELEF